MLSRRCQSDEDWHQVSCHSFPCQRRFCRRRRRRRRSGGGCCCGRLPQSACVLFQSPSQSIIHCDRARRREGEREAAGRREREAAGRREAGSREGRRERAERSWGSAGRARSEAARGEARPGEEAASSVRPSRSRTRPVRSSMPAALPPPRPAPLGPGAGRALSAVASSWAADSERSGPRACSGRAGSRAPGASRDSSPGTSTSAGVPAQAAPGWALLGGEAGNCGRASGSPFPGSRSPVAGASLVSPAPSYLRVVGSGSSPSLRPGGRSQAVAAASCRAREG